MRDTTSPSPWSLPEVRFGSLVGLEFAATAVARHLTVDTGGLVLGAVVVVGSMLLPWRYAVGLGVTAWAFLTGFVVNAGGQLSFAPDDVRRAAVLVGAAVLASVAAALGRTHPVRAVSTHSQPRRRNTAKGDAQAARPSTLTSFSVRTEPWRVKVSPGSSRFGRLRS